MKPKCIGKKMSDYSPADFFWNVIKVARILLKFEYCNTLKSYK